MRKCFTENGWQDYLFLQTEDKRILKKINDLLKGIERNGNMGIVKPEPLSGDLSGFWSRRINDKDRLVYRIEGSEIQVLACRYHYSDR